MDTEDNRHHTQVCNLGIHNAGMSMGMEEHTCLQRTLVICAIRSKLYRGQLCHRMLLQQNCRVIDILTELIY
jgi:hypothetical protein